MTPSSHASLDPTTFPQNTNDPFTLSATAAKKSQASNALTAKPHAPPTPSLIELPTCPVCLERMDETTGLLTILCQHVFHCACLEKWRGSGCPVCRYTQSPSFTFPYPRPNSDDEEDDEEIDIEPSCSVCATTSNLWICLICGNTGCGRYDDAHAYAHYEESSHCYAMDISTQHVWDYAGDGYVHRLIQNKPSNPTDSKNSTGNNNNNGSRHPNAAFREDLDGTPDMVPREKMEAMGNEYTFLLTSQLSGQRAYFEGMLERAVDKASSAALLASEASAHAARSAAETSELRTQTLALESGVAALERQLEKSALRADKFEKLAREMGDKWREEKMLNQGLVDRIHVFEERAEEGEKESAGLREQVAELEDMNRDLTIFISSQDKVRELQAAGEEVVEGSVSVPEGKGSSKKKGKGRKG